MQTKLCVIDRTNIDASAPTLREAAAILRDGGLVAFPTETVYGLGANALDTRAALSVFAAKGRPADNPLIVHVARPSDAEAFAETTPLYYRLAEAFMPGPLTVILKKKSVIPTQSKFARSTFCTRLYCPAPTF